MKIAIITDTHVGARSGSSIFREYFRWWYEHQFFAKLDEMCISRVLHLGDFFDNRNAVTLSDIDFVCEWFANQLISRGITMDITLGNHDVAHKNTNRIHSLTMLKAAAPNNVNVIVGTEILDLDGKQFVLVPWINQENTEETFKAIAEVKNKDKTIIAGHFSIAGAKHYAKSAPAEHGLDPAIFKEYQEVWSGHFHHKSKMSNVRYMGSAFHLNWQDYNDARGFHTFDTKTDELVFIENEYCLFVEIGFDADVFKKLTDSEASDMFNSRFIKLIVNGDYDKVALMEAVALINRSKPHDLQIINHTIVKNDSGAEFDGAQDTEIKVAKSTQEYIASYIESRDGYNTQAVKDKMQELLTKSLADMTKGE